jgi:exodeoxyribonuclease V alpha subunit
MTIAFDGRPVAYAFGELDQIVLAYASTIHKSQGSEFPAVVIPITTQHYMMLQRNLLYTGVTRGKGSSSCSGRRKRWRSPSRMSRAGGAGRSCANG